MVRREILDLYAQLHRAGVVHNDVAPHHWRRRPSDGICLIDFDSGIIRGNVTEEEWDELVVGEIEEVMAMLA
jgi:tRNA A-37 threonylcarbamoyl transferase component Bud32